MSWISSSVDPSFSLQETLVRSARPTAASTHLMEHEEEEQPASGAEERGHVESGGRADLAGVVSG